MDELEAKIIELIQGNPEIKIDSKSKKEETVEEEFL